jgi:hypothetical protein
MKPVSAKRVGIPVGIPGGFPGVPWGSPGGRGGGTEIGTMVQGPKKNNAMSRIAFAELYLDAIVLM